MAAASAITKSKITLKSGVERRMLLHVAANRMNEEVDVRLRRIAPRLRLDGFRPGKAPLDVVRTRYEPGLREEVLDSLIGPAVREGLQQQKQVPLMPPRVERREHDSSGAAAVEISFEVMPRIKKRRYRSVSLTRRNAEVAAADIDEALLRLRQRYSRWQLSDGAAKAGDRVHFRYRVELDGEELLSQDSVHAQLGGGEPLEQAQQQRFDTELALEQQLLGLVTEGSTEYTVTPGENCENTQWCGRELRVTVWLLGVAELRLPELDENFFKALGVAGGESALREIMRKELQRNISSASESDLHRQVREYLLKMHGDFPLPPKMLENYLSSERERLLARYPKLPGQDPPELPDELFREKVESEVRLALVVRHLSERLSLTADPEEVRKLVEREAAGREDSAKWIKWVYENNDILIQFEQVVLEQQVLNHFVSTAELTEQNSSCSELLYGPAPEDNA